MDAATDTDEALYRRWRAGDAAAGDGLAQRHYGSVLHFFQQRAPAVAEDLMQATFLACMRSSTDPEQVRSFRGFLFGVARNVLLRHLDGRGQLRGEEMVSHVSQLDPRTTPTQRIARQQDEARLRQAMDALSVEHQIALELYYWQRLKVSDVATALGLSLGGTRAKLHRARQALRREYQEITSERELGLPEIPDAEGSSP